MTGSSSMLAGKIDKLLPLQQQQHSRGERLRKAILSAPHQILAELCRRSLFRFIQEFWHEMSRDEPQWNWHIGYICSELMRLAQAVADNQPREYDLIINIPPGTTKSITCSIAFPPWCWTNWPWMRFIVSSYSSALSLEHAEYSRDLVRSEHFQTLFPDLEIADDKDTKSNFRIQRKIFDDTTGELKGIELGGNRYSTSVGGTLTGFHGHVLIVDDPINPKQAISEIELRAANHWMDQTLPTRKTSKSVTPTVIIMQRLHQDDPTGHILAKHRTNVKHICLPGEIEHYRERVNPPELAEHYIDDLLDPVRMTWGDLRGLEIDLGQYGYAGQIGQEPTPPGGGMFKVDHFQKTVFVDAKVIIGSVRYWDKAGTEGGRGAFTAGVLMHRLADGRYLISDVKRGRWASEEREKIIKETAQADGRDVLIFHEQEPGSSGKDSAQATQRNLAGFVANPDHPTGNKVYRADPYSVQVNNGNVVLLVADWNEEFADEHRNFPSSTHKDQVDAAAAAFSRLAAMFGLDTVGGFAFSEAKPSSGASVVVGVGSDDDGETFGTELAKASDNLMWGR